MPAEESREARVATSVRSAQPSLSLPPRSAGSGRVVFHAPCGMVGAHSGMVVQLLEAEVGEEGESKLLLPSAASLVTQV